MRNPSADLDFERALAKEIALSELMRMRVVAVTLAVLLIADQLIFLSTLGALDAGQADEYSVIIVGSASTRVVAGRMVTLDDG